MGEQDQVDSPGAALARARWAKTTKAERMAVSKMLVTARKKKLGKVRSQGRGRKARKS
jgi:hypothetical protein